MKVNKTKIIEKLKLTVVVLLSIIIGGLSLFIYQEGRKMWQEVTTINAEVDRYFESEAVREGEVSGDISFDGEITEKPVGGLAQEGETVKHPVSPKDLLAERGRLAFGEHEVPALLKLVEKESSFNHLAQNPTSTAFGWFQFLDSTWQAYGCEKTTDPEKQIECGFRYIEKRYGMPSEALAFHQLHNWY